MKKSEEEDQYSAQEVERRFKATVKRMLATPPKPHAESAKPRKKKAKKFVRAKPKSRGA
jgi:hypothetical protein